MKEINTITVNGETFVLRKKANWEYNDDTGYSAVTTTWWYECSNCGYKTQNHECYTFPKFCPECGSRMENGGESP